MRNAPLILAAFGAAALVGCQTAQQSTLSNRHAMLVNAGFVPKPATTPGKQQVMASLPPNTFVQQTANGKQTFLLAEPDTCKCVYMGDANAYKGYRGMANVVDQMEQPLLNPGLSFSNIDNVSGWDPM